MDTRLIPEKPYKCRSIFFLLFCLSIIVFHPMSAFATPTVTPPSHGFGSVAAGSTSAAQTFSIQNNLGTSIMFYSLPSLTGTDPSHFIIQSTTCSTSTPLAAYSSCDVNIAFQPYSAGAKSAGLFINTNDGAPITINLSGTGVVTHQVTPSAGTGGTISPASVQTVNDGATTTFTVTPNTGYTAAVAGTCGGMLSGTIYTTSAITGACTVIASFTLNTYALTVTKVGTGGGSVTPSTGTLTWTAGAGTATYSHGTSVTLTATANTGSTFTGWSGGGCSGTGTCIVSMDAIKSVTANFKSLVGYVTYNAGAETSEYGRGVFIQSDGKIVVAGDNNSDTIYVARYNTDGSPDTGFGTGGVVTYADTVNSIDARAVAVDGSGNIVVVGNKTYPDKTKYPFLMKYKATGILDTGFGTNGLKDTSPNVNGEAYAVAIQSDSKIVVAGYTSGEGSNALVMRFGPDGTLDSTFGSGGSVVCSGSNCYNSYANAVTIDSSGNIITAGYAGNGDYVNLLVLKYDVSGTAINSFGIYGDGTVTYKASLSAGDYGNAIALQPDGKIVVAGYEKIYISGDVSYYTYSALTVRFAANGSLDTSFGSSGVVTYPGTDNRATGVAIDGDGNIILTGYTKVGSAYNMLTLKYNSTGTLDTGFGTSGVKTFSKDGNSDYAYAVAIDANGGIIVAGSTNNGSDIDMITVKYGTSGTLDNTFRQRHWLTVSKTGTGSGKVTSSPSGIDCGATCSVAFNEGATVTLTAVADASSSFAGWSGDCTGSSSCSVTMNASRNVTAAFAINTYTVSASSDASGNITCTSPVVYDASSTCTITPVTGYHLSGLTDNTNSVLSDVSGNTYILLNVSANHTVSATFVINTYDFTPSVSEGNGSISPSGTTTANYGTSQTFTITPGTGYHIVDVKADGVSVGAVSSYTFSTVTANHTITASFAINTYALTVTKSGAGNVTPSTGTLTWTGNTGTSNYNHGTSVTLDASPNISSTFTSWSGDCSGSVTPASVVMDASKSCTATFALKTFIVSGVADGSGNITCTSPVVYDASSTCTITPVTGYHLSGLTDNANSVLSDVSGNTYILLNVSANHTITAAFAINTYTFTPDTAYNGSISPSGTTTANYGTSRTFTITPGTGYHIVDVKADGVSVGAVSSYTFNTVTANHTISATFAINTYTVTPQSGVHGTMTPSIPQTANFNSTIPFTITPNSGYRIDSVTGCSGTLSGNTYTTGPVTADCAVVAAFAAETAALKVTKTGAGSGTVTSIPAGIDCGSVCSQTFPTAGSYQFISTIPGTFSHPIGVAVDPSGSLYVTDTYNHRIQKFAPDGTFVKTWGSEGTGNGQFDHPHGMAVDFFGNVYVADTDNHRIQKFSSDGTFLTAWGGTYGTGDGQFKNPRAVAADISGNVYVADSGNDRVQKFLANGSFTGKWGVSGSGNGQFLSPLGIATDAAGNIYVSEYDNNRIQKFSSGGTFITRWGEGGTGNGQFSAPKGVAVDSRLNVFVADSGNDRIQEFSSSGTFITAWGGNGPSAGKFSDPYGVAVDLSGNVYVGEFGNNRIQKFASDNVVTLTAAPSTGSLFSGWSGDCTGTQATCTVAMDTSRNVTALFTLSGLQTYAIQLTGGWNFVSTPLQPDNNAIDVVLSDISANVKAVWGYENAQKQWLKYGGSAAGGQNTLTSIDAGKGFWVYVQNDAALIVTGHDPSPSVQLFDGWNLTGYNGPVHANIETALSGISDKWLIVWNWADGVWKNKKHDTSLIPLPSIFNSSSLANFSRGKAYWIKTTNAGTGGIAW